MWHTIPFPCDVTELGDLSSPAQEAGNEHLKNNQRGLLLALLFLGSLRSTCAFMKDCLEHDWFNYQYAHAFMARVCIFGLIGISSVVSNEGLVFRLLCAYIYILLYIMVCIYVCSCTYMIYRDDNIC